jgi:hypothetical protein
VGRLAHGNRRCQASIMPNADVVDNQPKRYPAGD